MPDEVQETDAFLTKRASVATEIFRSLIQLNVLPETIFLALNSMDRYLVKAFEVPEFQKMDVVMAGRAIAFLAIKYVEHSAGPERIYLRELYPDIGKDEFENLKDAAARWELAVLYAVKFNVGAPNPMSLLALMASEVGLCEHLKLFTVRMMIQMQCSGLLRQDRLSKQTAAAMLAIITKLTNKCWVSALY